jgi:hypothetical protein
MESEIKKEPHRRVTLIVFLSIILLFVVYYTVMCMMSPAKKLAVLRTEYAAKSNEKSNIDKQILKDSGYLKLMKEKAFLQSRIAMAESDSGYITINMADSSANLEICGVVVHKAKMSSLKISKILSETNENAILSLLSKPFTISGSTATIMKEPVIVQMAPKDTSEYKPDVMPDTTLTQATNYILETNQGVKIYVYQEEKDKMNERITQLKFDLDDKLKDTWSSLKSVAAFKVPEYNLFIKIRLPRADAKIFYRAIPKNGQIALIN